MNDTEEALKGHVAETKDYYRDALGAMKNRLARMIENQAFVEGLQWGIATDQAIYPGNYSLDDRERPEAHNYTRPTVRSAVASKLRNAQPNPSVIPSTGDVRGRARAMASDRLCRSWMRTGVVDFEEMLRFVQNSEIDGLSFAKTFWNPRKGRVRTFEQEGIRAPEGEIDVVNVSAIDALIDPHARRPAEIRHIFHRKLIPVSTCMDEWPTDVFGESTEGRWSEGDEEEHSQRRADEVGNDGASRAMRMEPFSGAAQGNSLIEVVECWERGTNKYPDGRVTVWSGDILVDYTEQPPAWPWTPIYGQNFRANSMYAAGIVQDIKSVQRSINMGASILREWIEFCLAPAVLNPKNSGVDAGTFENLPGALIEYNPGAAPTWWSPPAPPQQLFTFMREYEQVLKNVSTYSDITRGSTQPGTISGRAMAFMEQFEKGVHEPDETLLRIALVDILYKCLGLARTHYDEGRIIQIIGANKRWTTQAFRRDDFDFDVAMVVEPYSALPRSPALRYAEVLDLKAAGFFADTPEAERARRMLELDADDSSTFDAEDAHRQRSRGEQLAFLDDPVNSVLEVSPADAHEIHLEEDRLFRVSDEFLRLHPLLQQRYEQHDLAHEMAYQGQIGGFSQQQAQITSQSQGPGGGPPPPKEPGLASPPDGGNPMGLSADEQNSTGFEQPA